MQHLTKPGKPAPKVRLIALAVVLALTGTASGMTPSPAVIRARGAQHDGQFAYVGLNRLVACGEGGGTMVQFAYDTEEQLVGIRNEQVVPPVNPGQPSG